MRLAPVVDEDELRWLMKERVRIEGRYKVALDCGLGVPSLNQLIYGHGKVGPSVLAYLGFKVAYVAYAKLPTEKLYTRRQNGAVEQLGSSLGS